MTHIPKEKRRKWESKSLIYPDNGDLKISRYIINIDHSEVVDEIVISLDSEKQIVSVGDQTPTTSSDVSVGSLSPIVKSNNSERYD